MEIYGGRGRLAAHGERIRAGLPRRSTQSLFRTFEKNTSGGFVWSGYGQEISKRVIGSEITVSGVAGDSIAVLGAGYFELTDNKVHTGKALTILSNHGVPPAGEQATVQDTLRELYVAPAHTKSWFSLKALSSRRKIHRMPSNLGDEYCC